MGRKPIKRKKWHSVEVDESPIGKRLRKKFFKETGKPLISGTAVPPISKRKALLAAKGLLPLKYKGLSNPDGRINPLNTSSVGQWKAGVFIKSGQAPDIIKQERDIVSDSWKQHRITRHVVPVGLRVKIKTVEGQEVFSYLPYLEGFKSLVESKKEIKKLTLKQKRKIIETVKREAEKLVGKALLPGDFSPKQILLKVDASGPHIVFIDTSLPMVYSSRVTEKIRKLLPELFREFDKKTKKLGSVSEEKLNELFIDWYMSLPVKQKKQIQRKLLKIALSDLKKILLFKK